MLLVRKKNLILKLVPGSDGIKRVRYYQREYVYVVSGQEYTLNTIEVDSKAYKTIKYNPRNPNEAETYKGINTETIIVFLIGLISVFSPFILKITNTKRINEIKYKLLRMSKRNILKIVTGCFWGYMALSLVLTLKEAFLELNLNQIEMQYFKFEINVEFVELVIFIVGRCSFEKFTSYFNVFRD